MFRKYSVLSKMNAVMSRNNSDVKRHAEMTGENAENSKKHAANRRFAASALGLALAFILLFLSACSSSKSENVSVSPQAPQMDRAESWSSAGSAASGGAAWEAGDLSDTAAANRVQSTAAAPAFSAGKGSAVWKGNSAEISTSAGTGNAIGNANAGGTRSNEEAGTTAGIGSAGGIGQAAGLEAGLNRKLIYTAHVTMGVEDYGKAEAELHDAIHLSGAYILQFSNSIEAKSKSATFVIKVPAAGFSSFIDRLREIEKNAQIHMEGSDVTEEYVDLEARLQAKKAAEARLLALMEKASGTDDLVRFSSELAAVQEQIEQIKGRMRYIDQNVAYSTVNVRLYEKRENAAQEKDPGLGKQMTDALKGSAKALGQFGQVLLIFLAALLPVAVVLSLIGLPIYLFMRSRNRPRKEGTRSKPISKGIVSERELSLPHNSKERRHDPSSAEPENPDADSHKS